MCVSLLVGIAIVCHMNYKFNTGLCHIIILFIYLFWVLRRFQHCTGHIATCSWKGRGNQYVQFVRVLYCKLPTNGKQLPAFPLEAVPGTKHWPQRWKARVLPLCYCGPIILLMLTDVGCRLIRGYMICTNLFT